MKSATILLACLPLVGLGATGTAFLTYPTRVHSLPSSWFAVASVSALPDDGQPVEFPILAPQDNAWTRMPGQVLGFVYLRKLPTHVMALRAEHHGTFRIRVKYDHHSKRFRSCCWGIEFDLNGVELPDGPRMGDQLEQLPARIDGDQVFVRYEAPRTQ